MAVLTGCWPNIGARSENDNINLSNDIDLPNAAEENDNLSCIENRIIKDNNLLNVDFALEPDNDKTLNIFGEERKHHWLPNYIFDWYKTRSNIHPKDNIFKEINDQFSSSDDVPPFYSSEVSLFPRIL